MQQLLEVHLSIIIVKEKYTFLTSPYTFKLKLKEYFNYVETIENISEALNNLENNYLNEIYEREKEIIVLSSIEDFELISPKQSIWMKK
jgi:hypothetical protein